MELHISEEAVPEIMKEFVRENDGVFTYDHERAFKALKEEREGRRNDRKELAAFKALNVSADELARFTGLGKSVEELAELIANAANAPAGVDLEKLTESEKARLTAEKNYNALKKDFDTLKSRLDEADRIAADNNLRKKVSELIDQLPDDIDREQARVYLLGGKTSDGLPVEGIYRNTYKTNAIGDIEDLSEKSPLDYTAAILRTLKMLKPSTPGIAKPGNATLQVAENTELQAAKQNHNVQGLIRNAKRIN